RRIARKKRQRAHLCRQHGTCLQIMSDRPLLSRAMLLLRRTSPYAWDRRSIKKTLSGLGRFRIARAHKGAQRNTRPHAFVGIEHAGEPQHTQRCGRRVGAPRGALGARKGRMRTGIPLVYRSRRYGRPASGVKTAGVAIGLRAAWAWAWM